MTKEELNNLIATKLGDIGKVYWTDVEISRIIKEALLTFGAISGYWKRHILIESIVDQQLYDLTNAADIKSGNDVLVSSLTYADIVSWLDDNLVGYLQLTTLAEIIEEITKAINEFQTETKLVLAVEQYNITANQPVEISEDVLDVLAAWFIDSDGVYHVLQRADENNVTLINAGYTLNQGRPYFYSINNLSIQLLDLFPRPSVNGQVELIYVVGKTEVQTSASTCLIPNNLVPYLKYKVLDAILSKDDNADPFRAMYCKQRWNEGLIVGNNYSAIVNIKLNGLNKIPASMIDFNTLRYGWRNDEANTATNKKINAIATAGYNIIGFNRIPQADVYSALFECIANAPIDIEDDEEVDIRADFIPQFIDYCIHLASFKDGIASIQKTQSYLERFIKISAYHNEYLQNRKISYLELLQKSKYPLRQASLPKEDAA